MSDQVAIDYIRRRAADTVNIENGPDGLRLVLRNFDPQTGEPLPDTQVPLDVGQIASQLRDVEKQAAQLRALLEDTRKAMDA